MAELHEFEDIALPHLDRLYSFAYYLAGSEAEAEDLVQETMKKTMDKFDRFEKGTNFKAWASRIMKNLFIDRRRKKKPASTDFEKYEPAAREGTQPWSDVELLSYERLMDRFLSDEVKDALLELPEDYRTALLLNSIQGLSYEDIADILECPVGTVMSRLYRARQELKRKLSGFAMETGFLKEDDLPEEIKDENESSNKEETETNESADSIDSKREET